MTSFLHVDLHIAADWEKKSNDNVGQTVSFLLLSLFVSMVRVMMGYIVLLWVAFGATWVAEPRYRSGVWPQ